jgi:hypothetical protein
MGGNMLRDLARFPEPPTEVALPCLLRVKCGLQGFHLLYQFLDPIKHGLICHSGCQSLVMLDLAV